MTLRRPTIKFGIPAAAILAAVAGACSMPFQAAPPSSASIPVSSVSPSTPAADVWSNATAFSWQIQFSGEIDAGVEAGIFELDAFDTDASVVTLLQNRGVKVICYINAGAWEDWRPDRNRFPAVVLGSGYEGWPGEQWVDIREIELLREVLQARLDLCQTKGFDAVEFDNVDGFMNDTGFPLSAGDQYSFNAWLAGEAHQRGLKAGLKNDPEQAGDLWSSFDFAVVESCFAEGWCEELNPFRTAGKAVLAVEYTDEVESLGPFCAQAGTLRINVILKNRELDAWRETCR
jgi:hypothetical protein